MFDQKTYQNRREQLKKSVGSGLILLLGNEESSINFADNHYRFRQDSTYLYYIGIDQPQQAVILDVDEDREVLFANDPDIDQIIWTGPVPSREELALSSGIKEHRAISKLVDYLPKASGRDIHFLPPYRPEHTLKLQQWLNLSPEEVADQASEKLIRAVVAQRNVKTKDEIRFMEQAVNITGQMHLEAMRVAHPGMYEYEVLSHVQKKVQGKKARTAFPTILTVNGHILHNHGHGNLIGDEDVILCDAGAEVKSGYAGDMTRTFPAGKRFTPLQRDLYTIVLEAERAAAKALAPGRTFKDVHLLASTKIVEGLKDMGLMKGKAENAVAEGAHTLFFQCGLGHMMGLDVHDMENLGEAYVGYTNEIQQSKEFGLKSLRLGRELKPGFVLTVEPGIYLIPELIQLRKEQGRYTDFINYSNVEKYQHAGGYRVEDDYLVTEEGARLLGVPIPKTVEAIETLRTQVLEEGLT